MQCRMWVLCSLFLVFSWLSSCAQDVDPATLPFSGTTATYSRMLQPTRVFIFGWGSGALPQYRSLSESLGINAVLSGPWYDYSSSAQRLWNLSTFLQMPDSTRMLLSNWHIVGATPSGYSHAVAMQYDPSEGNTVASWNSYVPRRYDTSGAAFGFAYRHPMGIVPDDTVMTSSSPDVEEFRQNYNRYLLFSADYPLLNQQSGEPLLVLSEVQPDNQLISQQLTEPNVRLRQWAMLRNHNRNLSMMDAEAYGQTWQWQDSLVRGGDTTVFTTRGDSTEWYLALNLRRWPNLAQNAIHDTTTVVSVKLPYRYRIDTVEYHTVSNVEVELLGQTETVSQRMVIDAIKPGATEYSRYAVFDSTATTDTLYHEHYGFMDRNLTSTSATEFRIRKGMLPNPGILPAQARPDITLSGHFWLPRFARNYMWDLWDDHNNIADTNATRDASPAQVQLLLSQARSSLPSSGVVLDTVVLGVSMEIYYHGTLDVGIDYARFESRLARQILRGQKDSVIRRHAQNFYSYLDTAVQATSRGLSLYRHYFMDETPAPFWRPQRHLRRLLDTALIIENPVRLTPQHVQQSDMRERWKGWMNVSQHYAAPFLRYGTATSNAADTVYAAMPFRTLGLAIGYRGAYNWDIATRSQTLWHTSGSASFDYETVMQGLSGSLYYASDSLYRSTIANNSQWNSLQAAYEYALFNYVVVQPSAFYGPTPLWTQLWPATEIAINPVPLQILPHLPTTTDSLVASFRQRPHTGEELRFESSLALLLGAKGLTYFCGGTAWEYGAGGQVSGLILGVSRSVRPSLPSSNAHLVRSDSLEGTDFLDPADSLLSFLHPQQLAQQMGIASDRIYVGTSSVRHVMQQQHAWVTSNKDELLRLRLQAVYSKGFKLFSSRLDTTVHLEQFLDTALVGSISPFHVRRIHDRHGSAWTSTDEPFKDSTFFVVTLLADSAKSMRDRYYIGVLNRRTDPTIYYPSPGGTDLADSVKFFSTVEFDSLVSADALNTLYAFPQYAQHGSRQITLPLQFGHLLQDSMFSLIRIRDMNGTLDTIIAEDRCIHTDGVFSLALKLKPGEGRLLQIDLLHPGTIPEGLLAHSNQRKMVVVPDDLDSTKVRYHIVYHRWEKGHYEVFYRRSKALSHSSNEANIVWEAEVPISYLVLEKTDTPHITIPHYNLNCAYPSLVVRHHDKDWSLHIVYACEHPDTANKEQFIVEGQYIIDSDAPPFVLQTNYILDTIAGRSLTHWGTPVVGAISGGTMYAWADSLDGIITAYKPEFSTSLASSHTIRFSESSDSCQHPSLASYNRSVIGEKSTALVWQEDEQIYYASAYVDGGGAIQLHRIPVDNPASITNTHWLPHNADTTILAMCDATCTRSNRLPVVYRGIEPDNGIPGDYLLALDRIAWEGRSNQGSSTWQIYSRWIDLASDTLADTWPYVYFIRSGLNKLYSIDYSFFQPDLAQGRLGDSAGWDRWAGAKINGSDSAFVLSCISWYWRGAPPFTNANTKVWHLPYSYSAGSENTTINPLNIAQDHIIAQNGMYSHQAGRAEVSEDTWWRNRRVFEYSNTPKILSSAQYYYRMPVARSDYAATKIPSFGKNCFMIGFIEPWYKDTPLELVVQKNSLHSVDTLVSEWFPIGASTPVSFYVTGSDTSLAKVELVNQHTGSRQLIPLVPASDTTARLIEQTFINGGGYLYRLEFSKKDTSAVYAENLLAGPIPLVDSLGSLAGYAKNGIERDRGASSVVNLAVSGNNQQVGLHVYTYPNPAKETVSISVYRIYDGTEAVTGREELLQVRVVTALGEEVANFEARPGIILTMPVQNLPSGVYFVRVQQRGAMVSGEAGCTSFVVQR